MSQVNKRLEEVEEKTGQQMSKLTQELSAEKERRLGDLNPYIDGLIK